MHTVVRYLCVSVKLFKVFLRGQGEEIERDDFNYELNEVERDDFNSQ